jgi:hypothetical protein
VRFRAVRGHYDPDSLRGNSSGHQVSHAHEIVGGAREGKHPIHLQRDGRTTQREGYRISQKKRKRIEECFGWLKTIALVRKVRHRGEHAGNRKRGGPSARHDRTIHHLSEKLGTD